MDGSRRALLQDPTGWYFGRHEVQIQGVTFYTKERRHQRLEIEMPPHLLTLL
jgi:hypothetical protein